MSTDCEAKSSEKLSGIIRFKPPRIALTCLAAAAGLHVLSPKGTVLFMPYHLLGMVLLAAGFIVMMWAWILFRRKKTAICLPIDSAVLIEDGPYRFTRNPMYLGMAMMLCGTAFLFGSVIAFSAPATYFITINEVFIPFEEAKMERLFGDSYLEYKNRIRRWL